MKKIYSKIVFVLLLINIFTIIKISSTSPTQGLGGIGYGILLSYLIISLLVLIVFLFFTLHNIKIFSKYILYSLGASIIFGFTFSIFDYYDTYQNRKNIQKIEEHDKKMKDYFLKVKDKIHKREDVSKLIAKWNKEISLSSLNDAEDLLTIYFLLTCYDLKNEQLLEMNMKKLFKIPKLNPPYIDEIDTLIIKKENNYHINLAFDKAIKEIEKINVVKLKKNCCVIYKKYKKILKNNKTLSKFKCQ